MISCDTFLPLPKISIYGYDIIFYFSTLQSVSLIFGNKKVLKYKQIILWKINNLFKSIEE